MLGETLYFSTYQACIRSVNQSSNALRPSDAYMHQIYIANIGSDNGLFVQ